MNIYGAGMAGLLAANMLRRFQPVVHEAQAELPNNHEALLRFRSDAVSKATGIPFRKVDVIKCISFQGRTFSHPDIKVNNLYSHKVTGEYRVRSIGDCRPAERYIAPPDFIAQMAKTCRIKYDSPLTSDILNHCTEDSAPVISTIPMPGLMNLVNWESMPVFKFLAIWSQWLTIERPHTDVYQTIYYPDPALPYYRASITGNRLIIEYSQSPDGPAQSKAVNDILRDFGMGGCKLSVSEFGPIKSQKYGKLLPLDNDTERRKFLVHMTDEYNMYSLGRFSTWRQLLMDDVVNDVTVIERLIASGSSYARRLTNA